MSLYFLVCRYVSDSWDVSLFCTASLASLLGFGFKKKSFLPSSLFLFLTKKGFSFIIKVLFSKFRIIRKNDTVPNCLVCSGRLIALKLFSFCNIERKVSAILIYYWNFFAREVPTYIYSRSNYVVGVVAVYKKEAGWRKSRSKSFQMTAVKPCAYRSIQVTWSFKEME